MKSTTWGEKMVKKKLKKNYGLAAFLELYFEAKEKNMTKTFNSRKPITAELRIIHQHTDPNSTRDRTLSQIIKEVDDDKLILDLISYGQACDHYYEWKDHPNEAVRLSLATNGYFLEHYIHDESDEIKYLAISKQPELIDELLSEPADHELRFACEYLYDQSSPDVETLKKYLNAAHIEPHDKPKNGKEHALLIKYLAKTSEPDTMTKTMTPAQLFTIDHPLWAKDYEPEAIKAVQDVVKALKNMGYATKSDYAETLLAIADGYQNETYHYYDKMYEDAILTIKEQLWKKKGNK